MSEQQSLNGDGTITIKTSSWNRVVRERDEAIADRDIARLAALDSDKAYDRMVGELEKVYDERDEAREKAERYRLEANAMMLQRDEAISKL